MDDIGEDYGVIENLDSSSNVPLKQTAEAGTIEPRQQFLCAMVRMHEDLGVEEFVRGHIDINLLLAVTP